LLIFRYDVLHRFRYAVLHRFRYAVPFFLLYDGLVATQILARCPTKISVRCTFFIRLSVLKRLILCALCVYRPNPKILCALCGIIFISDTTHTPCRLILRIIAIPATPNLILVDSYPSSPSG
jgi:hypothetical protein